MSIGTQINRLSTGEVLEADLPGMPWSELPEALLRAFPDLKEWQANHRADLEEWRLRTNYILRDGI